MAVSISLARILQLAPNARPGYREAFQNGQAVLDRCAISATPLRVAHFLAQVLHESGGLMVEVENLNYRAERLPVVWPSRFRPLGPLDPVEYAHNPRKLANAVYRGRNGNVDPEDGFTYRGRGLLQLTGRENYQKARDALRALSPEAPDLVHEPDQVFSTRWCLEVAASKWLRAGCNAHADRDDILEVTHVINGGQIGLPDRREWLRKAELLWS